MRESTIEDYLVAEVKKRGGDVRKVKWIGRNGAPDRLVLLPGWSAFVELKAPRKGPRPNQRIEHDALRVAGHRVEVINTHEGVDALLA